MSDPADSRAPDSAVPDSTAPDSTAPESTAPESTVPDSTAEHAHRWPPKNWPKHLLLFVATTLSVFLAGMRWEAAVPSPGESTTHFILTNLHTGWTFAVPLMAILVFHEFGHYFAAVRHKVPASLPYFIPLPILGLFGTMGAVISMPKRIRSRNALMDIGAAGPLAGMLVAIPVLIIGLAQSEVKPIVPGGMLEGQCLLYSLLKRLVLGEIPAGYDVFLTPTALAGWTGLLITALNLIPVGQLDGGHIAYALFGKHQLRIGRALHFGLLAAVGYNFLAYGIWEPGITWLVWFGLLHLMRFMSGVDHPPTEPSELSPARKFIGALCMVLFVLLFMPTPLYLPPTLTTIGPLLEQAVGAISL